MSQLMQVDIGVYQICLCCPLISRLQDSVGEGDRADILHGTDTKLWNINHVILCEGEVISEKIPVENDSLLDRSEDLSMVNLIDLALPDKDPHLR